MQVTIYGTAVAASALLAVLLLAAQRRHAAVGAKRCDVLDLALCCIPAALVGARLAYCLIRADFYLMEMGAWHILMTWEGGFLLYGAVLGALLAAALLARRCGADVARTLDELAAPGLLAIAVCRLFEGTTGESLGAWVENEALWRFPLAVQNEYGEWQWAVFLLEAAVAFALLAYILRAKPRRAGWRIETALLLYACAQAVLESLRMDGCLKIGFVRVSQVISALVILGVTALRAHRAGGRRAVIRRVLAVFACAGVVGGIEWALDKTPVANGLLYAVMAAACAALAVNGMKFKTSAEV